MNLLTNDQCQSVISSMIEIAFNNFAYYKDIQVVQAEELTIIILRLVQKAST